MPQSGYLGTQLGVTPVSPAWGHWTLVHKLIKAQMCTLKTKHA